MESESTSLDDFRIEKVIGKGSFGFVYLVTRQKDNKIYALKSVILDKLSEKQQQSSVNEVRILASVNHPNVIGYKEAFWDEQSNSLNIVMEYADDGDLQTKINKMKNENGHFSEALIWYYSIQMIQGLKALHDKKIMHRDLKSANIFLVKYKNQCKIGDMNVSKVLKEKLLRTQTGTPYYASPEVWRDKPYSYKSDLWSIGCIIYELCELKTPFNGNDIDELFINVCRGKLERINKIYSDDLWNMINLLLQVDVDKRVNCDQFLENKIVKKKIEELKNNENYQLFEKENKSNYDEGKLLDTITFKDIKDIKSRLPHKKNYDSSTLESNSKKNSNICLETKNKNSNSNSNLLGEEKNNKSTEKKDNNNNNNNKILIKEIRKELEIMKLKEEMRKKEKKEKEKEKIKKEDNNREKSEIKEKIKQCERKLKEEKTNKIINAYKNRNIKKNKIIIPINFNKKTKYIKRGHINGLYKNGSLLSLLSKTSKNSIIIRNNNYGRYMNHKQNSVRCSKLNKFKKKNNINTNYCISEYNSHNSHNSHSPSCVHVNQKSQSFSNNKYMTHNNHNNSCKPYKIVQLKTPKTTISINKMNYNNKSSINLSEKYKNNNNIFSYITSINSMETNDNDNKYNYNISNLKKNNINSEYNKYMIHKNFGMNSTPDLGDTNTESRLKNNKKKDYVKYDININFNFIPNNFQRYLNNNRYQGDSVKCVTNKNHSNIEPSIKINNNINLLSKHKSFNTLNKISIDNNTNNYFLHNHYSHNNIKLNIPIQTLVQRKLTDINIEKDLKIIKNELKRNKKRHLEKYELNKPETLAYDIKNKNNKNENVITKKDKNKYMKKYNNYEILEKKNIGFLNKVKKETITQLLDGIKSNRTTNKYYKYQAQNYPPPKRKGNSSSLKYSIGNKGYNYLIAQIKTKTNNLFRK